MIEKKLQIFVSSTSIDLKEERMAAVEAILSAGHIPAGMELFSAGDELPITVIRRWIDESDVYLLILGGSYGSIEPKTGKSYIQLEYDYALSQNKPLFSVVISSSALDKKIKSIGTLSVEQKNYVKYESFKDQVTKYIVKTWDDIKDIKIAIHETLPKFSCRKEIYGWIRFDPKVMKLLLDEEHRPNIIIDQNTENKHVDIHQYTLTQLSIIYHIQKNNTKQIGFSITNIQKLLQTENRKNVVNSLNILNKHLLLEKFKIQDRLFYKITEQGNALYKELETAFCIRE